MVTILIGILVATIGVAYRLKSVFRRYIPLEWPTYDAGKEDVPSVTVCIPARNERHAMTVCLESVVASDYPKLEIIVLDDESGDETSLLIKSFAHAGVRFVEGTPLGSGWLGKNHALDGLLRAASGRYVFFMDVDTRLERHTISRLVAYIMDNSADMVSVLPARHDSWRASTMLATMRFFWEVLFGRRGNPSVVSPAWIVDRKLLIDELGGIASFPMETRPELAVAKRIEQKNRYRFIVGGAWLGVHYEKKWSSQIETAVRLYFPWLGSSWLRALTAVGVLLLALVPYFYLVVYMVLGEWLLAGITLAVCLVQMMTYGWYVSKVWPRGWLVGGLMLPVLLLSETWLVLASAVAYTRGRVVWKGRSIVTAESK